MQDTYDESLALGLLWGLLETFLSFHPIFIPSPSSPREEISFQLKGSSYLSFTGVSLNSLLHILSYLLLGGFKLHSTN